MAQSGESLANELLLGEVEHDDLTTVLATFFPTGEWDPDDDRRSVVYRTGDGQIGLTLLYGRADLQDITRGPGLTNQMLAELRARVASLTGTSETVIWQEVFFSHLQVHGCWRYRDEWQIVPAPAEAPRPEFIMADHPFLIETRIPAYPTETLLTVTTRNRRAWELGLILNLVVRTRVSTIGLRHTGNVWVFLPFDGEGELESRYLQPGYSIPGWNSQREDFTPCDDIPPLEEVPDEVYRSRRGISPDDVFDVPEVLRPVLDAYHGAAPETRDRFLRACYWYDRSGAAWSSSVSLGHIAAVNAIETLMPAGADDPCPTCGLNRSPGVTRRFRDFVERYAAATTPEEDRLKIYRLRSKLVHEGHLLDIDVPRPWGALVPRDIEQQDTYASARATAREAIINWLRDQS